MELTKIPIPKDSFRRIPKDEQVLFVLLGHVANELNVLGKLMGWCHNAPSASPAEADACLMQTLFLAKLLAGKLNEGWEALQRSFFGTGLSRIFHEHIEEPQRTDLQKLKRYFSSPNILHRVRNNFSFHYRTEDIKDSLDPSAEWQNEFGIYLAKGNPNCFYAACELVSNLSLLRVIAADDPEEATKTLPDELKEAMRTFVDELKEVRRLFLNVISGCMWVIISQYLGTDLDALQAEKISLEAPTDGRRFAIPYFVSVHDDPQADRGFPEGRAAPC